MTTHDGPDEGRSDRQRLLDEAARALHLSLAHGDLLHGSGHPGTMELMVLRFADLVLRIDGSANHGRPHLHVDYGGNRHAATYAIDTGDRLVGRSSRYDASIAAWIGTHRTDLLRVWTGMRSGTNVTPVVSRLKGSRFP